MIEYNYYPCVAEEETAVQRNHVLSQCQSWEAVGQGFKPQRSCKLLHTTSLLVST